MKKHKKTCNCLECHILHIQKQYEEYRLQELDITYKYNKKKEMWIEMYEYIKSL